MSWEDFQRHRQLKNSEHPTFEAHNTEAGAEWSTSTEAGGGWSTSRKPKRRRLFPSNQACSKKTSKKHTLTEISFNEGSQVEAFRHQQDDGIESFESDTDHEPSPKKQPKRLKSAPKFRKQLHKIGPAEYFTEPTRESPVHIDTFDSSEESAIEATPPPRLAVNFRTVREDTLALSQEESDSEGLQPGQMFLLTQITRKLPPVVTAVKITGDIRDQFSSSFRDLEEPAAVETPSCSDNETQHCLSPRRRSAASWLNSIKSPECKSVGGRETEDKSAKKLAGKKHPLGSLAQKAQSLSRYTRGEYLLWLHKHIASAPTPPFNETCFYGRVISQSLQSVYGMCCVTVVSCDSSRRTVEVLLPSNQKVGVFGTDKIIVVFPDFHCFMKRGVCSIVSLFHTQFFESDQVHLGSIPVCDHFMGVTERSQPDSLPLCSGNQAGNHGNQAESQPLSAITSRAVPELQLCVYHVTVRAGHVQVLGCDKEKGLALVEIRESDARQYWHQLGLSHGATLLFSNLEVCHVGPAHLAASWFPQVSLFSPSCRTSLHCLELAKGGGVSLQGDIPHSEHLVNTGTRHSVTCRLLGSVGVGAGRHLAYIQSVFGSIQWVESPSPLDCVPGSILQFHELQTLSSHHSRYDTSSTVLHVISGDTACSLSFLRLYSFSEESHLFTSPLPRPPVYNQYTPLLSPCLLDMTVLSVVYKGRDYWVSGSCCGVGVTAQVGPGTVRGLLGTASIAGGDLVRLEGTRFTCRGILLERGLVLEHNIEFLA